MVFTSQQTLNDKYQLEHRLGRTATGHQTWLATDISNDRKVAIKLLAFNPQMSWEELKLFEREAQILKTLDHSRIPKYYDYFDLDKEVGQGVPWFALVQQYIPGLSLQEILETKRNFTEENIRNITEQVLDVLIYLHQHSPSILHRDIKPSNLILDECDRLYLIDFGAVQAQAAVTGVTFTVVGTVGYAPLEQFWGRAVEASDLYALGATIIHLLTGKSPADLPQKDSKLQFRNLVTTKPHFTNWLEKVTELSLERRFQNAIEAKEALLSNSSIYNSEDTLFTNYQDFYNKKVFHPEPYSLVQIHKENGQLQIKIPVGGLRRLDELFNAGCAGLLGYLSIFMIVMILTVFIPGLFYILLFLFSIKVAFLLLCESEILFHDHHSRFTITKKMLGIKYNRQNYSLKSINNVLIQRTGAIFQVGIQINDRNCNLGGALSQNEAAWIVREIEDYL